MRGFGVCRGLAVFFAVIGLGVVFASPGAHAQTAAAQPGKPLALLAGLPPPHDAKHRAARHLEHARAAHDKRIHERTAGKTHRRKLAAHARHASGAKLAARHHSHAEHAVTAAAFADEPPPQAAAAPPPPAPATDWPTVTATSANTPAAAPPAPPVATSAVVSTEAAGNAPEAAAAKVQTLKITAANPTGVGEADPAPSASTPATANASAAAVPAAAVQPAPEQVTASQAMVSKRSRVGSASWIAQVLAAFGGAVTAGAVAWFLIGSGPVRTYG